MSVFALAHLSTTDTSGYYVAQSDSGGPSPALVIVVIIAVLVLLAVFGGAARQTVVVVENPGRSFGTFLGLLTIAIAVGIVFFAFLAPGSGSA